MTHETITPANFDFARLIDAIAVPVNVLDSDLCFVYANDAYCASVKMQASDLLGRYVFDAFPDTPERVAPILAKFQAALNGEITYLEETPFKLQDEDGEWRDHIWQAVQRPYRNADGVITHVIQRCDDVTEAVALRQQNEIVSAELDHRVRNTLAVVQAVATLTGVTATSVDEYVTSFLGRLNSMARNFSQLSKGNWKGLTLKSILEDELAIYVREDSSRVNLLGPDTMLSTKSTKDAALIIHELATNAAKYGCFSNKTGQLEVDWVVTDDALKVIWSETGMTGITAPTREGFGYSFLQMMPNMIVTKNFRDEGLHISFEVPVRIAVDGLEIG